jgi:hypothetical protein
MTSAHFGNPFPTASQLLEDERNSSMRLFQSALDDESSLDDHNKTLFVGKEIAPPGISPSSTLDFDNLDASDMHTSSASSSSSSLSVNVFGLEKCPLEKRQSNGSIGLPSSYPLFFHCKDNSVATCATYPEDLDDFEDFRLQFEKSKISANKPALHPLLFSELPSPPPPPKTVTPEQQKPKHHHRRARRNQVVITSTEHFQDMVAKSNNNRRRRNMALPSTTEIEEAIREELSMGPISIEGKLTL